MGKLKNMWSNGTRTPCWWECKLIQSLWKPKWEYPLKLRKHIPDVPSWYTPNRHAYDMYLDTLRNMIRKSSNAPDAPSGVDWIGKSWEVTLCGTVMQGE